uniref:NmrA-like domain-containing protein n=1 Tax=Chlamydomonas leiostraca TaxID=1034604 RepID=A0A7S0R9G8_9CHLO|mmetsp:Transcript_16920/g.42357  ORF Transcript_16920/g.42357 Transcript_16920/m.42357 type:complete len:317 (+) Transcript_16920:173-1123(+)
MAQRTILVASATANTGSKVVQQLSALGGAVSVRALARNPDSDAARALGQLPHVTLVRGDFNDHASIKAALQGVQRAYLVSGNGEDAQYDREVGFIQAAEEAGVELVVRVSTASCLMSLDSPSIYARAHARVEQYISQHNSKVVDLNPNWFMSNLVWQAGEAAATGKITYPFTTEHAASGPKLAMIDPRDVAGAGVVVLTAEGEQLRALLAARRLEVHGPQPVTFQEQLDAISAVTGKPLAFNYMQPDAWVQMLGSVGTPPAMAEATKETVLIMSGVKQGPKPMVNETSPTLAAIWQPKYTIADWAKDNAAAFAPKA